MNLEKRIESPPATYRRGFPRPSDMTTTVSALKDLRLDHKELVSGDFASLSGAFAGLTWGIAGVLLMKDKVENLCFMNEMPDLETRICVMLKNIGGRGLQHFRETSLLIVGPSTLQPLLLQEQ